MEPKVNSDGLRERSGGRTSAKEGQRGTKKQKKGRRRKERRQKERKEVKKVCTQTGPPCLAGCRRNSFHSSAHSSLLVVAKAGTHLLLQSLLKVTVQQQPCSRQLLSLAIKNGSREQSIIVLPPPWRRLGWTLLMPDKQFFFFFVLGKNQQ